MKQFCHTLRFNRLTVAIFAAVAALGATLAPPVKALAAVTFLIHFFFVERLRS